MNPWSTEYARRMLIFAILWLAMFGYWSPSDAALLLVEVLPDPALDWDGDGAVDSRGDEWVEFLNTGPETLDLAGYYLRDALGEAAQLRLSGELAPGEVAVFHGSDAVAWQQANGLTSTGLSLNNAGDYLELFAGDPETPEAILVDALIYPAHVGVDDRSLARFLPEDEWVLCDGLSPYGGDLEPVGSGCEPTPGVVNACPGLVPTVRETWGGVKSIYRP